MRTLWGDLLLSNEGGSWKGHATGAWVAAVGGADYIIWWTGSGGYAGLTYFELVQGGGSAKTQGQIYPGAPPPSR